MSSEEKMVEIELSDETISKLEKFRREKGLKDLNETLTFLLDWNDAKQKEASV